MIHAFEEGRHAHKKGKRVNPYSNPLVPGLADPFKARLWSEGQAFEKARS